MRLNGIARAAASASSVDLTLVGQAGTIISSGVVEDAAGGRWSLPALVAIPSSGQVVVTATAQTPGAVSASAGSVNKIATPTRGWQSVTNASAAAEGAPVETDAALRARQAISVALPSRTVLEGIIGAVATIDGVTRYRAYENDTAETDENGIPSHSLALVVEGGDAVAVASAIEAKKSLGAGTAGTTIVTVKDSYGIAHKIRFYRPTIVNIAVTVTLTPLTGYTALIGEEVKAAIAQHINALGIGQKVMQTRLFVPANLSGAADGQTYEVTGLTLGRTVSTQSGSDVAIAFNEAAACGADDVTLLIAS
ncbi:baseplate J/gp47 family protein [Chitinasiproducens palmae]|uniref:baseplate J/gp47 family protein n=1 Tax=Chitinasiproducens palmae TaxID=1770053 RepID=UPI002E262C22